LSQKSVLEKQVAVDNPFEFDLSRFMPNEKIMDLPRFLEIASDLIDALQEAEGKAESDRVKLVADFHPERFHEFDGTVITYKVLNRRPAKMNAKGTGRPQRAKMNAKGTGRPQRAATFAYDLRSANNPNKVIIVESRPIDHRIQFSVWSKNADHANRLALWLENNFITHTWAFQVQGAERFYWEERGPDTLWTTGGQRLHQRPLVFFLRLREFENKSYSILRLIDLEININT
jgi:hypothetical protein